MTPQRVCGHWHCPDDGEVHHTHPVPPEACEECAERESDRARLLREKAQRIAESKRSK